MRLSEAVRKIEPAPQPAVGEIPGAIFTHNSFVRLSEEEARRLGIISQ